MTYFSVDVETTATTVIPRGLLSIGVKVVNEDLSEGSEFYKVIRYPDGLVWDNSTLQWWITQDLTIFNEALNGGIDEDEVAFALRTFVQTNTASDQKAIFVANPVAFDKPWIDQLFLRTNIDNPFDYRSLCLRSMHFGLRQVIWGGDRETWGEFNIPSELPHHALYDAKAQAKELIAMLKARDGVAYS